MSKRIGQLVNVGAYYYLPYRKILAKTIDPGLIKSFVLVIEHFTPFVDKHSVIRIETKISMRDDLFDFRYPILLPIDHYLIGLLIREKKINAEVAPLPLNSIRDAAISEVIGIDFTGPVYLKRCQKAWISIFTCEIYRAVHLELTSSLSVASLLMALRRHIARRSRTSIIYSDIGKNYVGLNNALKKIDLKRLTERMIIEQIEWRFNPPSAPWWGGFEERLLGVLKRLLRRYEEMMTTLADCESVTNSRPITFISDGYEKSVPLMPSMFLHEIEEIGVLGNSKGKMKISTDIKVGNIVLIGSDNSKRVD